MQEENEIGGSDALPRRSAATNTAMTTSSISSTTAAAHSNCSYETVKIPERGTLKEHAIFGTLWGDTMIENYQIYRPKKDVAGTTTATTTATTTTPGTTVKDENRPSTAEHQALVLVAYVKFGSNLNGHSGVVHGGIQSLMFDDIMGFACGEVMMQQQQQSQQNKNKQQATAPTTATNQIPVTANLSVDFRKPVLEGVKVRLEVNLEHREGRKLYWKARMFGNADDGKDKDVLYAEATSLYILINK